MSGLGARGMARDLSLLYRQRPGRTGSRALSAPSPQSATQDGSGLSQEPRVAAPPDLPDLSDQQADLGALSAGLCARGVGRFEATGLHRTPQQLAATRGELGAALSPTSAGHLRAGSTDDRSADRRAARVDPGADVPAPTQNEVPQDGLCAGQGGYFGKAGRTGGVSKKTSNPNWPKRKRASGWCCS